MSVAVPGLYNEIHGLGVRILGVIPSGPCLSWAFEVLQVLGAALLLNPHPETLAHPPSPGAASGGTCRASTEQPVPPVEEAACPCIFSSLCASPVVMRREGLGVGNDKGSTALSEAAQRLTEEVRIQFDGIGECLLP